jgi:glycosyltransferase involved in cell wall biosynthesis
MDKITFIIFTYNEAARIERVIRNFKDYGKILIADNSSQDGTINIAKSYGCDVLIREQDYDFVENQHLVELLYEKTTTEWIYWGFADEMLEAKTLEKITTIISADRHDIVSMDRKNYNNGVFCYDLFHGYTNKLFKKRAIDFTNNKIHGMGVPMVPKERIYLMPAEFFIHHFSSYTISSYLNTINRYTENEIQTPFVFKGSVLSITFQLLKRFLKNYIFEKGYKAGFTGLESVLMIICYEWVKNIKRYEQINNLDRQTIEEKNNLLREQILTHITN